MRLKEKISNIDGILNKIDNASVFSYKRKDLGTDNIYVGVSAQE